MHTPKFHWCGNTNKLSKRTCNRKFRRVSKLHIISGRCLPNKVREVMNLYSFNRDGSAVYHKDYDEKWMRK